MGDGAMTTLTGKYVRLRPMTADDAEMCLRWRQSPRAVLLQRGAQTIEEQREWFERQSAADYNWIIEVLPGTPVGMLGLQDISPQHLHAESSHFLIGEEEATKGLPVGAEAMYLLYEFAFLKLGLHRVWGRVASDNVQMVRWHQYIGKVVEGTLKEHFFINGHWQDACVMGMLAERYFAVARPKLQSLVRSAR
jgi:RimJ/RimL family protein N-acetyltransferase